MNPTAFATAFRHWGDTREGLHLDGVLIALPLRTERRQQPWRHHRSRSRQRVKDEKIGMRFGRLLNLPIQAFDTLVENLNQLHRHLDHRHLGLHHGAILQRRHGLPDGFDPALDQLLLAAVMLAEKAPQGGRSEEHTSELQSRFDLVCRLLLEKKKKKIEKE